MTSQLRRRWLAVGLAIGVLGLIIRIWLFQQPVNSDDVHYFGEASTARSMSDLGDASNANGMRLMVMAIPAAYSHVVESPRVAFYGTIYTVAILSFVGIYWFAWLLSGPRAAAFAAALWATSYVAVSVDTRLLPDNLGTALALIGLAWIALGAYRRDGTPAISTRRLAIYCALGGFFLWLSFCARESFFIFGGVGVAFGLVSKRRWVATAAVFAGLFAGFLLEYACMSAVFGDGLLRWKVAFAYQKDVAAAGAAATDETSGGFGGYTFVDLVVRYPKLIAKASGVDLMVFVLGLAGCLRWAVRFRERRNLAKLGAGLAAYLFIAFGIVSVSPIVPLMREKLRYYATAAPFLSVAAAELLAIAVFARVRRAPLARWLDRPHRTAAAAALSVLVVLLGLRIASRGPEFARNGNDAHWTAADRILADASGRGRAHTLFTDFRTTRVTGVLMPRAWIAYQIELLDDGRPVDPYGEGYLLLDWRRLNANTKSGFVSRDDTHVHYRYLERDALVMRHRHGGELLDVFYMAKDPIRRDRLDLEIAYPEGWRGLCGGSKEAFTLDHASKCKGEQWWFSGDGAPWRAPGGRWLPGDQFVEIVFVAHAPSQTALRGQLNWWPSHEPKPQVQLMGAVQVGPEPVTFAMWTYLPQEAESFRVALRGPATVVIDDVQTYVLRRDALDDVSPAGPAWPTERLPDRRLAPLVVAIAADARAHDRPRTVYADPLTVRVGRTILTDGDGWSWRELGDHGGTGYEIRDANRAPSRSIDRVAIVARSNDGKSVIDAVFADDVAREATPLTTGFDGWTHLVDSAKRTEALSGHVASFRGDDPDDEFVYSGPGVVWQQDDGARLPADHYVQVTGTLGGVPGRNLRALLYWWSEDGARHTQSLGTFTVGAAPSAFAGWTYVADEATSYRVAFRAGDGVELEDVSAVAFPRRPDEPVTTIGKPW